MVVFVDEFDGVGIGFSNGDDALPGGGSGFAVVDNIFLTGVGLPGDCGVVGLVEFDFDFGGSVLRLGETGHDGEIGGCDAGEVVEIHELDQVIGSVLAGEFFVDFNESDGIESGVGERGVVAAASEPVTAENKFDAEVFLCFADDEFGESGEFAGIVGFSFLGEDSDAVGVFLTGFVG